MDPELFHAAVSGDEGKLRGLLGKNVRIKEQVTPRKNTALHLAAMKGHAEIVEMLLAHNSSAPTWVECVIEKCWPCTKWFGFERRISRAVNREGNTAFHEAVVEALLDHDARSAWSLNNNHESAFFQACEKGHLHVVTYLLKVTNPWIIRWSTLGSSLTCLHGAVLGKNLEVVKEILSIEPSLANKANRSSITPLHIAAHEGHTDIVKELLETQPISVYAIDNEGRSCLHISAMKGDMGIVQEIMLHSPDCLELITNDGKTTLHLAIENEKEEVVDYMLSTPHISQFIIDKPDDEGNTALHLATMKTLPRMVSKLLTSDHGVNVNARNKNGKTALDMAERKSELQPEQLRLVEILQEILEALTSGHRVNVNASNKNGKTALDMAQRISELQRDQLRIVKILEAHGAKNGSIWPHESRTVKSLVEAANSAAIVGGLIVTVSFEGIFTLFTGIISNGQREIPRHIRDHTGFNYFIWYDSLALITSLFGVIGMLCVASWRWKPSGKHPTFWLSLIIIFASLAFALAACSQALDIALPERKYKVLDRIFVCTCCFLGWYGSSIALGGMVTSSPWNLLHLYKHCATLILRHILKYFFKHF